MRIERHNKGFSLVELIIAMAIMVIIMAAIMPQFRAIQNSWASSEASANMIQNGRVLEEHIIRNLSAAKEITSVSPSGTITGFIIFKDAADIQKRYMVSGGYVVFGALGSEEQLAGPVSRFKISCYSLDDFNTATIDANTIRLVEIETDFTNSNPLGTDRTFISSVYLRTNANAECDLVGHWKLDETSGSIAADSSVYSNDGTLSSNPLWVTGQIDNGLDFDGINDYVSLPIGSVINSLTNCTITSWVNWGGGSSWQRIWDFGTGTTVNMSLTPNNSSNSRPRFAITTSGSGGEEQTTAPSALSTDVWHHIAVTIDADNHTHKMYIDGSYVAQNTSGYLAPADLGETGLNYLAKSNYAADPYFNGTIDDVRIYNRILSATEIAELANILRYREFTEAKTATDTTSITITKPTTDVGDLLIAAVATDGSTTFPTPSGWTEIDQGSNGTAVTLGAWYKIAGASESAPTFTWSGNRSAYGWMMRFSGHDSSNPIEDYTAGNYTNIAPTSPEVTTTVDNCIILRLGAFDDGYVTTTPEPGAPGLPGHTAITMDRSNWIQNQDIGTVSAAGSVSYLGGMWTVLGSGADIWGTSDEFHYVYQSLSGDGQITAWVASVSNTHDQAKAGVMIRETLNANSKHAWTYVPYSGNINFHWRSSTGGSTNWADKSGTRQPRWVRLTRTGNTFRSYTSANGSTWTQVGSDTTISMAANVYIGIAVTSHNDGVLCTGVFSNVTGLSVPSGAVSGGAGYVGQSAAGSSGTSTFTLGLSDEARTLTIAIAPANASDTDCSGGITP